MTIEIKGTRSPERQSDGAERFASRSAWRRSGAPYQVAVAIAAVAAYLKGLFGDPVEARQPEPDRGPAPVGTPPRLLDPVRGDDVVQAAKPAEDLSRRTPQATYAEAVDSAFDLPPAIMAQPMRFSRPDPIPDLGDFKPSPVIPSPTNDNAGRAGNAGGGGAGGTGGGGADDSGGDGGSRPDATTSGGRPDPGGHGTPDGGAAPGGRDPGRMDGQAPADEPRRDGAGTAPPGRDVPVGTAGPRIEPGNPAERRNRAPVVGGAVDLGAIAGCALLPIALSDLLRGALDPDGDALSVRGVRASSGSLSPDGGAWIFDGDGPGRVTISYVVTDGELEVAQTAYVTVLDRTGIRGGDGDDQVLGTPCADDVVAGAGDDVVLAGDGDDVVFAGSGADVISGGAGHDRLFGEAGNDLVYGEAGDDLLDGGDGNDILVGGDGNDVLLGGSGDDRLDGGAGADVLQAGDGRDVLQGGDGDDRLDGGGGDDVLLDGPGGDVVLGGGGDDVFAATADGEADVFDGGDGSDTLDVSGAAAGATVDLAAGTVRMAGGVLDVVVRVENVRGSAGGDALRGDGAGNVLSGLGGNDVLAGAAGDDVLDGGDGDDVVTDGTGSDFVVGGAGDDVLHVAMDGSADEFRGGDGKDTLDLSASGAGIRVDLTAGRVQGVETGPDVVNSVEVVVAGAGDDVLAGSAVGDDLQGGDGTDTLVGMGGDDVLSGGAGDDTLSDGAGRDVVSGGDGDDVIVSARDGDPDFFDGGDGRDTLDLSSCEDDLAVDLVAGTVAGAGAVTDHVVRVEIVRTGSGGDLVRGDAEDDDLDGGAGADMLTDGAGKDRVRGGAGDDRIVVAHDGDADEFDGGDGSDTLDVSSFDVDLVVDLDHGTVRAADGVVDKVARVETFVSGSGHDTFVVSGGDIVLTGGGGRDAYVVLSPSGGDVALAARITDFSVGDHVDMMDLVLFDDTGDGKGTSLADALDASSLKGVRLHVERGGDEARTVLEADRDGDGQVDATVVLVGQHTLVFTVDTNASAVPAPH
jgi:Ca2+-binding RTX toxin-like protein